MEQIAIVGDIHMDVVNSKAPITTAVTKGQRNFLFNMVGELKRRNINKIVFLGDVFDKHSKVSIDALDFTLKFFRDTLKDFSVYVIAGNHDLLYENSSEVISTEFLSLLPNIHYYGHSVGVEKLLGKTWYFVPWVLPGEYDRVNNWLGKLAGASAQKHDSTVIAGHFDMIGALMEAGNISQAGFEPKRFEAAAKWVFSGHYHCKSQIIGNNSTITYTGTPYHLSFAHVGTDCGFYIMGEDDSLEFVENTISPRFVDVVDTQVDSAPDDLSNCVVRYHCDRNMNMDDATILRMKLNDRNPIHIVPVVYGDVPQSDTDSDISDEETKKIMSSSSLQMASMYLEKHPEVLPSLADDEADPKEKVLAYLREYDAK